MAAITTFPTITNCLVSEAGPTLTFTGAGSLDIEPGMVVDFDSTGVTRTAQASLAVANDTPIGVALTHSDVSASEKFTVAMPGCVCVLANYDDTTGIDAGHWVMTNANAIGGTIGVASIADTALSVTATQANVIGITLGDIAGGGTGEVFIMPNVITQGNSS